jgi:hypothetical protein
LAYGRGGSALPAKRVDVDHELAPLLAEAPTQRLVADDAKKKPLPTLLKKRRSSEPQPATTEPSPRPTPEAPVVPAAGRYERTEVAQADTAHRAAALASVLKKGPAPRGQL